MNKLLLLVFAVLTIQGTYCYTTFYLFQVLCADTKTQTGEIDNGKYFSYGPVFNFELLQVSATCSGVTVVVPPTCNFYVVNPQNMDKYKAKGILYSFCLQIKRGYCDRFSSVGRYFLLLQCH